MVAAKFGKADPDLRSRMGGGKTKETADKPMVSAGMVVPTTGMIGGISNRVANPSSKKSGPVGSFAKGGKVTGCWN